MLSRVYVVLRRSEYMNGNEKCLQSKEEFIVASTQLYAPLIFLITYVLLYINMFIVASTQLYAPLIFLIMYVLLYINMFIVASTQVYTPLIFFIVASTLHYSRLLILYSKSSLQY